MVKKLELWSIFNNLVESFQPMTEEIKFHLAITKERMEESIKHLEVVLAKIRAGKANPQM